MFRLELKNFKGAKSRVKRLVRSMPVVSEEFAKTNSRVLRDKTRENFKSSAGESYSPRIKGLIKNRVYKQGNNWVSEVSAEKEAALFEEGIRPHWVAFFPKNPKPSLIGTPRSKFRDWASKKLGMSESDMMRAHSIRVRLPATHFMAKTFRYANRRSPDMFSTIINRKMKEVFA